MADEPAGFLGRWSRRKTDIAQGKPLEEPVAAAPPATDTAGLYPPLATSPATGTSTPAAEGQAQQEPPEKKALTLADARLLTKDSDFKPFMAGDVTPDVRNAAMKQLFADPHFNVMDGLDTYIDDYTKSDPIPESMLRQMTSAKFLNLFDDEEDKEKETTQSNAENVAGEGQSQAAGLPRESANNPTVETVAQSYENPDIVPSQPPGSLPTSQSRPDPAGASQQDHAHTDLRLQPDHAAPAPGAGHGTQ